MKGHQRDRAVAQKIARGDREAFDAFFRHYFPRLFRFVLRRVGRDEDLAKDIVQESLCVAMNKIASYRGEASLLTWLCQICRSQISAYFRKFEHRGDRVMPIDDAPEIRTMLERLSMEEGPFDATSHSQLGELVHTILDNLPSNYGDVLELKYIHELSVQDIADQLGTSMEAVQSSLARARKAFRMAVQQVLPELDKPIRGRPT